jgi:SRSO17 transposase
MTEVRKRLDPFVLWFDDCIKSSPTRDHMRSYVAGQVSSLDRKSVEPIALASGTPPRTLQHFLSSAEWEHDRIPARLCELVMRDHADENAVATIDKTGFPKKGSATVGVKRQYCGQSGKFDSCLVSVHLGYAKPGFQWLPGSEIFLPEDRAEDPARREAAGVPNDMKHQPNWKIALGLLEEALHCGVRFAALTADEEYGRTRPFREGVEKLGLRYVVEVPCHTSVWAEGADDSRTSNARADRLLKPSDDWQPCRVKDTDKEPVVWRARALRVRVRGAKLKAGQECWLIAAGNTLEDETKYFLSNMPKSALREAMLRVAFARRRIERCLQDAEGEVGMGHNRSPRLSGGEETPAVEQGQPVLPRRSDDAAAGKNAGGARANGICLSKLPSCPKANLAP